MVKNHETGEDYSNNQKMSHPIRGNTDTRTDSQGPVLSGKWPQEEPALVSVRWSEDAPMGIEYRYKRRFTPPSPIWKVAARKVNLLWYRHRSRHETTRSADTREDSRHPVLSGKWWRERWIYSGIDTAIDNVRMCTRNADTRVDSRRPVLSGKWQRRKV